MQGTSPPACKMRLGHGQAGKSVAGRAPDTRQTCRLSWRCFWGRTGSVPTHPHVHVACRSWGVQHGKPREGMTGGRRQKGPLGLPVKEGWESHFGMCRGLAMAQSKTVSGRDMATFQRSSVPHTISLALLPWPCNIVKKSNESSLLFEKGSSALCANMWSK